MSAAKGSGGGGGGAAGAAGMTSSFSGVGGTVSGKHTAAAISNLLTLQNIMRKDPESYREEFLQQHRHYTSLLGVFKLQPALQARDTQHFQELISFLSHVATCYRAECNELPTQLLSLVTEESTAKALSPALRKTIVQALILLGMNSRARDQTNRPLNRSIELNDCVVVWCGGSYLRQS